MDENVNKPAVPAVVESDGTYLFSEKEKKLLAEVETEGVRPVSPTLAMQFFELYLEGYSCAAIAKINSPFREGDLLFLRKKFKWDEEKDTYAYKLQVQMRDKLIKTKLEALEFITNSLAVVHKMNKEKQLRYLQTGKEDDIPETWITGPTAYKSLLEAIQKLTGEDRVTTQNIKSESKVTVDSNQPITVIGTELQSKMLKKLALSDKKEDKGET